MSTNKHEEGTLRKLIPISLVVFIHQTYSVWRFNLDYEMSFFKKKKFWIDVRPTNHVIFLLVINTDGFMPMNN